MRQYVAYAKLVTSTNRGITNNSVAHTDYCHTGQRRVDDNNRRWWRRRIDNDNDDEGDECNAMQTFTGAATYGVWTPIFLKYLFMHLIDYAVKIVLNSAHHKFNSYHSLPSDVRQTSSDSI